MKNATIVLTLIIGAVMAKNKPFPQNETYAGISRPAISTMEMNRAVAAFYDGWKNQYIKKTVTIQGGYYLATGGGTNAEESAITVSEGHGYGMLTTVLMAGYDKDAKEIFDGFYKVFREYPSDIDKDLMTWQILGQVGKNEVKKLASSATDGDFDIAYALVLADRQWGSEGSINYLAEAKKVIDAIGRNNVHPKLKRILLGDWVEDGNKYSDATRSSDWVPSHFRLFNEVTGNELWDHVRDTSYSILFKVQDSVTGLIPDFTVGNPIRVAPEKFLETDRDGHYSSNACRDPWRLAMDVLHYSSEDGVKALTPLLSWIDTRSGSDLSKMDNGYSLDGKPDWPVDDWGTWGAYSAPMMLAASIDPSYKKLLDSGWKHNSVFSPETGYYGNSIRMLCLLAVSGNWWNPSLK